MTRCRNLFWALDAYGRLQSVRRVPIAVGASLIVWQAWMSIGQISIWRTDLTLWSQAAVIAPLKPRVVQNYGLSLLAAGQTQAGIAQLYLAIAVAQRPHVPIWDRLITERTAIANLTAIREAR